MDFILPEKNLVDFEVQRKMENYLQQNHLRYDIDRINVIKQKLKINNLVFKFVNFDIFINNHLLENR